MRWITRHGVVTTELVARRFFFRADIGKPGLRAAYRRVRALDGLGLLTRTRPPGCAFEVLRVSTRGARIAGVGLDPADIVLHDLRHTILLVWLTEYLLSELPNAELVTERELWAQRYREGRDGDDTNRRRTPDGLLLSTLPGSSRVHTVAIELDRVRKDRRSMVEIIRGYSRNLDVDLVWWFVSPQRVARVRDLVRSQGAQMRIQVYEIPKWRV